MALDFLGLLTELGVGVASSGVYDAAKSYFGFTKEPTVQGLTGAIQNALVMNGVTVNAGTIVEAMASGGIIVIKGSRIFAPDSVTMGSINGGFSFGDGSSSKTNTSEIVASKGATIVGTGNTAIVQHPDGSIRFYVGKSDK